METKPKDPKAVLRVMLILWGAMLVACFTYAVVLIILKSQGTVGGLNDSADVLIGAPDPLIGYGLAGFALMCAIMGVVFPSIATKQMQGSPFVKLQTSLILRCGFFDAIAIAGLVAGVLEAFPLIVCVGFIAAGAAFIGMTLPWLLSSHERIAREQIRQTMS